MPSCPCKRLVLVAHSAYTCDHAVCSQWEEEPHHAPLRRQAFGSAKPFGSVTFATLEAAKEATGERRRGKGNRRRTTRLRKRAEAVRGTSS